MVPGVTLVEGIAPAALVHLAGRRRRAGQRVRRQGVDLRRTGGPVLPPPLPARAARPELDAAGRAGRVRRDPALLVRAWRSWIPDRRRARARQGSTGSVESPRDPQRAATVAGACRRLRPGAVASR